MIKKINQHILKQILKDIITITCYNFNNSLGSGTVYPQNLATIGGKKLYFHFIVYKISQESSRHIIYTFYEDIK